MSGPWEERGAGGRKGRAGGGRRRGALGRVVRAGVGRRRAQTTVMVLTTLVSVAASVLALGLLVASRAPFDHALARQRGAHLTVQFDSAVTEGQLADTARLPGVAASSGPFGVASVRFLPMVAAPPGYQPPPLTVVGRPSAGGEVDRVDLVEGRWAAAPGEIVLEAGSRQPGMRPGTRLETGGAGGAAGTAFTVVGIAESVGESADAWVVPAQLSTLAGDRADRQMLYRLTDAGTAAAVESARAGIAAALPPDAVTGAQSYLDVRQSAQENTAAYIPFVTAFAVLGLAMSVLVIGIVVSGAVGAATRRIGILKALGFTPLQVGRAYVAQALIPAAAGALPGVALGNALAVPLMAEVARSYGTGAVLIPAWVSLVVPAGALALVAVTASVPALRAARLRTARVLGMGRGAGGGRGRRVRHCSVTAAAARAVSLGLASPFARPARSATMAAAVAFGALAVTFAVGLGSTLVAVQRDGDPDRGGEVTVRTLARPGGGPPTAQREPADPAAVAGVIAARPETASSYRIARAEVSAAGLKGGVQLVAYEGDVPGADHTMVSGRWFGAPGEAVVATRFLRAAGVRVGDSVVLSEQGGTVRLRIVGEVFDLGDKGMTLRTDVASVAALESRFLPSSFIVRTAPGTDAGSYVEGLNAALKPLGADAEASGPGKSSVIRAMQALIAMLTLMLVAVACLGVLNTVVLDTRDRVRDLGVFKALGMTPRQTVVQVLTSVGAIGLAAGVVGVPLGVALHGWVMPEMGRAVGTTIPPADVDVYGPALLGVLVPAGVLIAVAGALLPAGWAARTRTAQALRAE
ncbi:FtsX-like permease family protein [Streptomyces sp. ZAF1911]|uniref:ABC transporter permease n=1 Tax=Streptomyces sp. ZAF1911 TaxID=2944129 RepID=UPI00237A7794|nr:FtsX-like permease family protein [Streptomyces sp. ZAF1911]MDD9376351.1 FtsX-like permease family protein [Streptomyces sp. ZAF1911]